MAWLSEWLQQIIAVILLAGIIDLMLPSNAYQRYVRLVAGLLILLTLLTPILRLLQGDFETKLKESLNSWPVIASPYAGSMDGLEQIQELGRQMREDRLQQTVQLAERRIALHLREELQRITGLHVSGLDVRMEINDRTGEQRIARVDIVLGKTAGENGTAGNEAAESEPGSGEVIEAVNPVAIEIDVPAFGTTINDNADRAEDGNTWGPIHPLPSSDERYRAIVSILTDNWGVAPEAVKVSAPTEEDAAGRLRRDKGGGQMAD